MAVKQPFENASAQLEIRLFGKASVTAAGVEIKFAKRTTTIALLALVILQRGRPLSRDSLAFTLFPEADEGAALAELRRYLYLANKSLPARAQPWLAVDSETVRWNAEAGAFVDVVAFEALSQSPQTHARAIDLYAGDLLEENYDEWVVGQREQFRTRYLEILGDSLDRYRAERDFGAAVSCAKRMLATDPWREDTLRALLAVRYESGDTAGALAEYDRFAKRLRDDLAIAPMPETEAVRQSILRNEAVPGSFHAVPPAAEPAARRTSPILPFVGRVRELATLQAAWTRAARGASTFVLLSGEAGVGKTRLTAELARSAQAEGGRVFVGTTAAPESTPYQAIVEALRSGLPLLLARPPAPARRAALARILPELRDPDAGADPLPEGAAELETARIYDALAHAVRSLASPRPLLLVLEDLHWAGSASVEALGAIVRDVIRMPILIVATCRDEETAPDHPLRTLLRSLSVFQNVEELPLERLGVQDVAELVTRVEGIRERGEVLARDLYWHSEGNALYLNEAINAVLEGTDPLANVLSTTIAGALETRIARLDSEARAIAEVAAVAGAGCSAALVREVTNLPAASVALGFDQLLDRRILREAGARARFDYVFTHHLIASAVYDRIDPDLRSQRHLRIGRMLERYREDRENLQAREIARHYELGGEIAKSADWYLIAAREAAAVHAYGDAIDMAGHALRNSDSIASRRAALELRERARDRRGDRGGQREDIDALEALAGDDDRQRFDVLVRRVLLARNLGESDDEGRLISEMERVAIRLDEAARAQALTHRATHAGMLSRQADGIAPAKEALEICERLGDVRGQLECLYLLVDFMANLGEPAASRAYLALMSERAQSVADQLVEARALSVASTAALLRQNYRESYDLATRALALYVATNDREGEATSRGRMAVTAVWLNDYQTALSEFDLTLKTYESIGNKRGLAVTYTNRVLLLMRLGMLREALESIERSNTLFETAHEKRTVVANTCNASFVMIQMGDAAAAKELAATALSAAREIGFPVFEAAVLANLGNAERALGEIEPAIEHMQAGIALRRPLQSSRDFVDDLADLTLAYVGAGRTEDARSTAEELETIGPDSFDGALWPHYIRWAISQGLEAGGELERARQALHRSRGDLKHFAEGIADPKIRSAFLALPVNVRIAGEA